jgi:hypothetical protein
MNRQALDAVRDGTLGPAWRAVNLHHHSINALEAWGLAEFRRGPSYDPSRRGRKTILIMGRLTAEGVRVRDDYHRRSAERRDNAIRRDNKRKRRGRK